MGHQEEPLDKLNTGFLESCFFFFKTEGNKFPTKWKGAICGPFHTFLLTQHEGSTADCILLTEMKDGSWRSMEHPPIEEEEIILKVTVAQESSILVDPKRLGREV